MLRRPTFLPLLLAFHFKHPIPSALAFNRASSHVGTGDFQRKATSSIAQDADADNKNQTPLSNTEEKTMSSNIQQQLFGRFKISPSQIFHRTTHSFAMVNLRPLVPGHVLVCSNRITPLLSDLREDEYDDLWRTVRVVQKVLQQKYKCDAFNVSVQDGAGAGQSVPHTHVHILPRYVGDLERNDDIYVALDEWAPRDEMVKRQPKLDVLEDSERRDRTMEEMEEEALIYQILIGEQSD
mmetsp:Transcript_36592/g.76787  ORF Transcript_36592/g.76787 Transcript_36592/m.76787 type:complete len:238 (-) Transcript_36592:219-932(-)